ncbi:T-cell surface glycoprotein CD8 alpha chain [Anolis carolinensis]|uniref:CD8 subunit alpha n=1 Tax=Anolis carolinensis TaxID=28377 RepID=G1KL70_ANOCA|nr:PREDICTED: T-cell surface glycoprotein CD8 alpha chain [Anolis carolinensis]|eukprot:XP_008111318.1 PREDICTED: T-cell surface glycoprotein CD8 alpha chain [Anolis carolinensis]
MARKSSIFCLLGLMLCCCKSQSDSIKAKMITSPQAFGSSVEFKCETSKADNGMYWMSQRRNSTMQFILYISTRGSIRPDPIVGYSARKDGNNYHLTVKSFQKDNQGIYYCVNLQNQNLIFSPGLPVYLPETTTQPPTIPHQISTTTKRQTKDKPMECPNLRDSDEDSKTMFSCEIYIWVPLVGSCFILSISLVITIVCCGRRRRRRCKCKRLMNGAKGAHPLPH